MTTQLTLTEMTESLNNFDEIAIEKHFGLDIYTQAEAKPMLMLRALAFVAFRRDGDTDADAKLKAQTITVRDLNTFFADEPDEIDELEPETEAGKGV